MARIKAIAATSSADSNTIALLPADEDARKYFAKLKVGQIVTVEVIRQRNLRFNAKVHLIIERLARAKGVNPRNMRGQLAARTGRADMLRIDGALTLVPWATGPRDMSAAEFAAFWDDAKPLIRQLASELPNAAEADAIIAMIEDGP